MMKEKLINYIVTILIFLMILFRIIDRNLFQIYDNLLSYIGIILIFGSSIYFSFKLKFIQFNPFKIIKVIKKSKKDDIKALFMSMGAKIGVGSIAGISLALYTSGPGVLLWVWIISFLSSILTYCESYLGVKYKECTKNTNNGGTFYYISRGVKNKKLSFIYTIILIFVYVIGFIGIQANTIVKSITFISPINHYLIILLLILVVATIIFNKIDSIISFMSRLVPFMCLLYLVLGILILINGKVNFFSILRIIIKDAFKWDRTLWACIITGLKRGIFATESGIGTSSIASSISDNTPETQGLFQVLGVHFISLFVITITGFIIINDSYNYVGNINGIEIIMNIFHNYFGLIGSISLCIIIILFAISTIVSGYFYGSKGIEYLKNGLSSSNYFFFKLLIILFIFLGGIVESSIIWSLVDSLVLILLLINIYSLIKLRREIS